MLVDICSDLVCPWCYIGKRRLEAALVGFAHRGDVEVEHRSFQLDPTLPKGQTFAQREILMAKYGLSEERVTILQAEVERTAAGEGLEYHLDGGLAGNTFDAHRLVHLARDRGIGDAVVERFFRAHFTEQRSLFDGDSLVALSAEAGLDTDEVRRVLAGDDYAEVVLEDARRAAEPGATGVPFFVLGGNYGISGA